MHSYMHTQHSHHSLLHTCIVLHFNVTQNQIINFTANAFWNYYYFTYYICISLYIYIIQYMYRERNANNNHKQSVGKNVWDYYMHFIIEKLYTIQIHWKIERERVCVYILLGLVSRLCLLLYYSRRLCLKFLHVKQFFSFTQIDNKWMANLKKNTYNIAESKNVKKQKKNEIKTKKKNHQQNSLKQILEYKHLSLCFLPFVRHTVLFILMLLLFFFICFVACHLFSPIAAI